MLAEHIRNHLLYSIYLVSLSSKCNCRVVFFVFYMFILNEPRGTRESTLAEISTFYIFMNKETLLTETMISYKQNLSSSNRSLQKNILITLIAKVDIGLEVFVRQRTPRRVMKLGQVKTSFQSVSLFW